MNSSFIGNCDEADTEFSLQRTHKPHPCKLIRFTDNLVKLKPFYPVRAAAPGQVIIAALSYYKFISFFSKDEDVLNYFVKRALKFYYYYLFYYYYFIINLINLCFIIIFFF